MRKWMALLAVGTLLGATQATAQEEAEGGGVVEEVQEAHEEVKEEGQQAAAEAGVKGTGTANYGTAGCGLGSLIFEPDSGFTQVFAATTNGTSGSQTFGITSGTSNCEDTGGGTASTKSFIATNRRALSKDIARGRGETIASLTELAGCGNSAAVGKTLQKNFRTIFPSSKASDQQVSDSVVNVLKKNRTLSCGNLA